MKVIDSLDKLMGGAVAERFNDALTDVLRNALDPNTSAKVKRQIMLIITVKPDKNRKTATFDADVKKKIAPPETLSQTCLIEKNDKGKVVAYEDSGQLEGQLEMPAATDTEEAADTPDNVVKFTAAK